MGQARSCTVPASLEVLTGSRPSGSVRSRRADGRGTGIPAGVMDESSVIRQTANGIRIDAGKDLSMVENVVDGIDGDKLMKVADGINNVKVE